jgi:hypothetical protein
MLEKILLAASLTFTLSLLSNLSRPAQATQEIHWTSNKTVLNLAQKITGHN